MKHTYRQLRSAMRPLREWLHQHSDDPLGDLLGALGVVSGCALLWAAACFFG